MLQNSNRDSEQRTSIDLCTRTRIQKTSETLRMNQTENENKNGLDNSRV